MSGDAKERCMHVFLSVGGITSEGDLTPYGLFALSTFIGAVAGLMVKAFKTVLLTLAGIVWGRLPAALDRAGWTPDSGFSLANYLWIVGGLMGALVGVLSVPLMDRTPAPTVGAWARHIHRSPAGTVPVGIEPGLAGLRLGWVSGFALLALLTALSGASVGPEPLVVIAPSALAGSFAAGPLRQGPQVARAAALAGGAAGLSAFFGLPVASAFAVLELPHIDGMQFAVEAMPACMVASLAGALFGDSVWKPRELLGDSSRTFPGGFTPGEAPGGHHLGLGALLWAGAVGLLAGAAVHVLVISIKKLHHPFLRLRGGPGHGGRSSAAAAAAPPSPWRIRLRRAAVLAAVGALNGGIAILFPSSFFWGEEQLQAALTRGCVDAPGGNGSLPVELPFLYQGLLARSPSVAVPSLPCERMPANYMVALGAVKLVLIMLGELSGFAGGCIYPVVFACASLGSAVGASPWVTSLGGQYIYVSTAASIAVGLAALLNAKTFALFFVLVIQENVPLGSVSAQLMALLFAISLHYLFCRVFIHRFPNLNMISTQTHRRDVKFFEPTWDDPQPPLREDASHASESTDSSGSASDAAASAHSRSDDDDEERSSEISAESIVDVF